MRIITSSEKCSERRKLCLEHKWPPLHLQFQRRPADWRPVRIKDLCGEKSLKRSFLKRRRRRQRRHPWSNQNKTPWTELKTIHAVSIFKKIIIVPSGWSFIVAVLSLFTIVAFKNDACISGTGNNGTCYSSSDCSKLGGTASGSCASGFGVCCLCKSSFYFPAFLFNLWNQSHLWRLITWWKKFPIIEWSISTAHHNIEFRISFQSSVLPWYEVLHQRPRV